MQLSSTGSSKEQSSWPSTDLIVPTRCTRSSGAWTTNALLWTENQPRQLCKLLGSLLELVLMRWLILELRFFLCLMDIQISSLFLWWWLFHLLLTRFNTGFKTVFLLELNSSKLQRRMLRKIRMKWKKFTWINKDLLISREIGRIIEKKKELKISTHRS